MAKQFQLRRGTELEHQIFTGAIGEVTVVTDDLTLRVHDGVTPGGHPISGSLQNTFATIAVSGQATVVADTPSDTLTLMAGNGISLVTNDTTDSITISNVNNTFTNIAVSGQLTVVADTPSDTLTLIAGNGISLTTNNTTDSITITNVGNTVADGTITDAKMAVIPNTANGFVKLDLLSKLPAVDGSLLTNIVTVNSANTWNAQQSASSQTLTDAVTVVITISKQIWYLTTSASRIIAAPTNGVSNTSYRLIIMSNGYTPAWNTAFKFPGGIIPTNLSGICVYDFFTPDGSVFYCTGQNTTEA